MSRIRRVHGPAGEFSHSIGSKLANANAQTDENVFGDLSKLIQSDYRKIALVHPKFFSGPWLQAIHQQGYGVIQDKNTPKNNTGTINATDGNKLFMTLSNKSPNNMFQHYNLHKIRNNKRFIFESKQLLLFVDDIIVRNDAQALISDPIDFIYLSHRRFQHRNSNINGNVNESITSYANLSSTSSGVVVANISSKVLEHDTFGKQLTKNCVMLLKNVKVVQTVKSQFRIIVTVRSLEKIYPLGDPGFLGIPVPFRPIVAPFLDRFGVKGRD
ncbi:hypothetical protein RFI_07032 [Reticulomyxa filosa]|uniref:Homologous recombination OB-fold protein OB-fold domain-containing protein n=1 Tax=Reticulomyxa filosa TaxID=46433 RepID=X6NW86_RETFI|nr:hypothetical protein RFI_07032 [Reticulomyxa filosa]|eukprot:ETO30089.1 hypothetical protein RFI_07032 [Reticulomyxa filosa]